MNVLGEGKVDLIDYMGSDLTVVNSARVSFNKEAEWDRYIATVGEHVEGDQMTDWERNEYLPYH